MSERGSLGMWIAIAVAIMAAVSVSAGPREAHAFQLSLGLTQISLEAAFGAVSLRLEV